VDGFFEDLGVDVPHSKRNIDIAQTTEKLQKWFHYYCGEDKHDYDIFERELFEREKKQKEKRTACNKQKKEREVKEKTDFQKRK